MGAIYGRLSEAPVDSNLNEMLEITKEHWESLSKLQKSTEELIEKAAGI